MNNKKTPPARFAIQNLGVSAVTAVLYANHAFERLHLNMKLQSCFISTITLSQCTIFMRLWCYILDATFSVFTLLFR